MSGSRLLVDCGSTTTKLVLIAEHADGWRLVARAEAPTTVEKPHADVMVGLELALAELSATVGRRLELPRAGDGPEGLLASSSAGGGLQMLVLGLVRSMTAETARRAALGAGAIVSDVIAWNDGAPHHQRIDRIRSLRPDMVLLGGAVDGGAVEQVVGLAEMLAAAGLRPRHDGREKLPVIYAGNRDARDAVSAVLGDLADLSVVENIRPTLDCENTGPAREKIHDVFMRHVMTRAPGYPGLLAAAAAPVLPTPAAVGEIVRLIARDAGCPVLAVDVGGATTDVFTVADGDLRRSVSANLGVSYSAANVLEEVGARNIGRWLCRDVASGEIANGLRNKSIRPTTLPHRPEDLELEQATAREAIRLAVDHHAEAMARLGGIRRDEALHHLLEQEDTSPMPGIVAGLVLGAGGVLARAPERGDAVLILLDAVQPAPLACLALDSIGALPHLGALACVDPDAARSLLPQVLLPLGTCFAPRGESKVEGEVIATITVDHPRRGEMVLALRYGEVKRIPLERGRIARITASPVRGWDCGAGRGRTYTAEVSGGETGLVLDGRGRPIVLPADPVLRRTRLETWRRELCGREVE